jgi:hypothetical protein
MVPCNPSSEGAEGGAGVTLLLGPLVSVVHFTTRYVPEDQFGFGTQLLAVTQISVPTVTPVSVYVFKHGCGAMDSMSPSVDV